MKIITIKDMEERIKNKYPQQPFEILDYTRMTKPITIKCLKCNRIQTYSSASNYLNTNRKGVCLCYNNNNSFKKHEDNKQKILKIIEEKELIFKGFDYKDDTKKFLVLILCRNCNQIYKKTWTSFLKNSDCSFCKTKQKMNTEGYKQIISKEYKLLSNYSGQEEKVLIEHSCGFRWKITPHLLASYIGCPQCNKKRSKGERKISEFLEQKNISYEMEKSFDWQTNKRRRYDFFLPQYNLIIEYMGEQHYRDTRGYFNIDLEEQKKIDKEKFNDAINAGVNYLEISYKDYNNIETILSKKISSTTMIVDTSVSKE